MIKSTQLTGVRTPMQAPGRATLLLPVGILWRQFVSHFACEVMQHLAASPPPDIDRLAQDAGLDETTLNLTVYFDGIDGGFSAHRARLTRSALQEAARYADDLADNQGGWRELGLDLVVDDAAGDIMTRLRRVASAVWDEAGPRPALVVLTELIDRLARHREEVLRLDERWSASDKEEIEQCARELRTAAVPKNVLWRTALRLWPNLPAMLWSKADLPRINSRTIPAVERLARHRVANLIRQSQLNLFDRLLGRSPEDRGLLGTLLNELEEVQADSQRTTDILKASAPGPAQSKHLLLASHIDDLIDLARKIRLKDVYLECGRHAGATPRDCARKLLHQGIVVDGVRYRPATWHKLEPAKRARAIQQSVCQYLGYRGKHRKQNGKAAKTAFDLIMSVSLAHPLLRQQLQRLLPDFQWRSQPFGQLEAVGDAAPDNLAFLYCYDRDRRMFEELLQVPLANRMDGDAAVSAQYRLAHPFALTLLQFDIAGPGGAQRDLQRAMRCKAQLRRSNTILPLFMNEYPEVRLLPYRSADYDDSVALFEAAEQSQVVVPLASGNFNLLKREPRVEHLFAPQQYQPQWQPADTFQDLIRDGAAFFDFVQAAFPALTHWPAIHQRLKSQFDPISMCDELVQHGVLIANRHGLYQMAVADPPRNLPLPLGLYKLVPGPLVGLSRDAFISQLTKDDWLYNIVFWHVLDAFDRHKLCESDVPAFMIHYLQNLERVA